MVTGVITRPNERPDSLERRRRTSRRSRQVRIKPARVIAAVVVACLALWVGATSFGYAVRRGSLELAKSLAPNHVSVLSLQTRKLLEQEKLREAEAVAVEAIARDPTAVDAIVTLGIVRQVSGDAAAATRFLDYARHLSRRNLQTHLWAIESAVARGDIDTALRHYDLALRTSVQSRDILFPILGNTLDDPQIAPKLLERLKGRPLWWDAFLYHVATDSNIEPFKATGFLVQAREVGLEAPPPSLVALVGRSVDARQPEVAWRAYMLTQPGADRRRSRDPNFARSTEFPALFDWVFANEGGISTQRGKSRRGGGDLNIAVGSGAAGQAAEQLQFLPPGTYRLHLSTEEVELSGGDLTWTVTCLDGDELARVTTDRAGTAISRPFQIPSGCSIQRLKLTASASDSNGVMEARIRRAELLPVT